MENIIFIILNLLFLMILMIFLAKQGGGAIVLEQSYAKQIALLIDSAKPGMTMVIDMEKGKKLADKNGIDFSEVVKINGNSVFVKLSSDGGYSYDFFNDVGASTFSDKTNYVVIINEK